MIKSEEKESPKVVTQEEIFKFMKIDSPGYYATTKTLSFKNSQLNNLYLKMLYSTIQYTSVVPV